MNLFSTTGAKGSGLPGPSEVSKGKSSPIYRRRSTSVGLDSGPSPINTDFITKITYSTPQPSRRFSNPGGSGSSGFYSYSPDDARSTRSFELKPRRYSQPTSPSAHAAIADPLIEQEKASYSTLRFLPEVQTYLNFIEDTIEPPPQQPNRSKSFSDQHSMTGSLSPKPRQRSQSRSPGEGGEEETSFAKLLLSTSHKSSEDQIRPPPLKPRSRTTRSHSVDIGNPIPLQASHVFNDPRSGLKSHGRSVLHAASLPQTSNPPLEEGAKPPEDSIDPESEPLFRRCFEQKRRSSTIRTSFI